MGTHEPQWPVMAACMTLLVHGTVNLFMSQVVAQALTAPSWHVLLLCQCLPYRSLSLWHLNLQPFEQALVGPVRIAPAPVALLRPLALQASPPLVVWAVALPAHAGVWGVVEVRHFKGSSWPQP